MKGMNVYIDQISNAETLSSEASELSASGTDGAPNVGEQQLTVSSLSCQPTVASTAGRLTRPKKIPRPMIIKKGFTKLLTMYGDFDAHRGRMPRRVVIEPSMTGGSRSFSVATVFSTRFPE